MGDVFDPWAGLAWDDDDDEEAPIGEGGDEYAVFGAEHIMMLLDCRPAMFERDPKTRLSPMDKAVQVCNEVYRTKVFQVATMKTGKRDGLGVLLFGCTKDPNQPDTSDQDDSDDSDDDEAVHAHVPTTNELMALEAPGSKSILEMKNLVRGEERDLEEDFCNNEIEKSTHYVDLKKALSEATTLFNNATCIRHKPKAAEPHDLKTMWIFTMTDPEDGVESEESQEQLDRAAKDAEENRIYLRVYNVGNHAFSADSVLVQHAQNEVGEPLDLEALKSEVSQSWKKKRRVTSFPILFPDWKEHLDEDGDPIGIMVDAFRTVQFRKKPTKVDISQKTNVPTIRETQWMGAESGRSLRPVSSRKKTDPKDDDEVPQFLYFAEFAGERVAMSPEEVARIKKGANTVDKPSLLILGFRDVDEFPEHHTVDKTYLLFPNDSEVRGSTAAFANLHASMLRRKLAAIGELMGKKTSMSRLVAVFPQAEGLDEDGDQIRPPGLVVVTLPLEDDFRALAPDEGNTATDETVEAAAKLIQQMQLRDVEFGHDFQNGALDRFWRYLESVVLEAANVPATYDTEPDDQLILENAGPAIDAFLEALPEDVVPEKKSGAKRKAKEAVDDTGHDWENLYRQGELGGCTVNDLKSYLRAAGLPLGGRKDALIQRIESHIEARLSEAKG